MASQNSTPKVSILIPVWNREAVISDTVRSALAQTFKSIEIVIVDNASTDNTWSILEELSREDGRIRIFRNDTNLGPVRNWLRCVEEAKGELSKILWSDDLISADYLEKTIPLLDTDVGFVYSAARVIFEDQAEESLLYVAPELDSCYPSSTYLNYVFLRGGSVPVSPGCALMRSVDLKKVLTLDVPNRIGSDFSMHAIGPDLLIFMRLCVLYSKVGYLSEPLSVFKAHGDSITIRESSSGKLGTMYNVAKATFIEESDIGALTKGALHHFLKRISSSKSLKLAAPFGISSWQDYFPSDAFAKKMKKYIPLHRRFF